MKKKRGLALLLALALCLSLLSTVALAAESDFTIENGVLTKYNGPGGDVVIPNGVTSIGSSAFGGCKNLTSVTIPASVTSMGYHAFRDCDSLTGVYISDVGAWCGIKFADAGSANPLYPARNLYLNGELVTNLVIPDGVASIGNDAFLNCTSVTSITIPDSVTSIGDEAFYDCDNLTNVTIGNGVTSIGDRAFYRCTDLASIAIPNSVTSIGKSAFKKCTALTSVTIPDSITTIMNQAFYNCESLTSITIPDSVTSIEFRAFSYCTNLTSIVIPEGLTSIGDGAFQHCKGLTSVTISDSVTNIGESAFFGCTSLTDVTIPGNVTTIKKSAFDGCASLNSVTISAGVTSIEDFAFQGCSNLTSVTIPVSVTSVGKYAFNVPYRLTDVYYEGSRAQWEAIAIGDDNDSLNNATIHYNSTTPVAQSKAQPSTQTVNVDGKPVEFAMYALGGGSTNYIRVRDLAVLLNGTAAQFEVDWDGKVTLTGGKPYTGAADKAPFSTAMPYTDYTSPTYVNGQAVSLEAIQITHNGGGYTYYKLRDLAQALGFNVGWSASKGVYVETNKPYDPNN